MQGMTSIDVRRAADVARKFHRGQTDKAGRAYLEAHVLDVHRRVLGEPALVQAVALLHDVLEDTACDEQQLRREFPPQVVDAVVAMTHFPGEPLTDYYRRVRADPIALKVKLADIASNTDPARTALLDPATRSRLAEKYRAALIELSGHLPAPGAGETAAHQVTESPADCADGPNGSDVRSRPAPGNGPSR